MNTELPDSMRRLAAADPSPVDDARASGARAQSRLEEIFTAPVVAVQSERVAAGWRSRRSRLAIPSLALAVAAVGLVVALVVSPGSGPSLVARAYAATSTGGEILHYTATTVFAGVDKHDDYAAAERSTSSVWAYGSQARSLTREWFGPPRGRKTLLENEYATKAGHAQSFQGPSARYPHGVLLVNTNPVVAGKECDSLLATRSLPLQAACGGPLEVVRNLYRSGRLHAVGHASYRGRTVDVLIGVDPGLVLPRGVPSPDTKEDVRVLVDPATFEPLEVAAAPNSGTNPPTVITFASLQRLTPSSQNLKLLQMKPHLDACVTKAGAALLTKESEPPHPVCNNT
jgi:hypothetical protein